MESNDQTPAKLSRRDAVRLGAGLAAGPVLLAAGGPALGQQPPAGPAASSVPPAVRNPLTEYPKPPFKKQQQEPPGLASKMDPRPDHGETELQGLRPAAPAARR